MRKNRKEIFQAYCSAENISLLELQEILTEEDDSFEMLLLRAILIQGLRDKKLLDWMYIREPQKCTLAARDVLSGIRRSSVIHQVFLMLLYPDLIPEEDLAGLVSKRALH